MFTLRKEVSSYVSACEHLISAATMQGNAKLSADECEMVEYYAGKVLKLIEPSTYSGLQLDMLSALLHHETVAAKHSDVDTDSWALVPTVDLSRPLVLASRIVTGPHRLTVETVQTLMGFTSALNGMYSAFNILGGFAYHFWSLTYLNYTVPDFEAWPISSRGMQ